MNKNTRFRTRTLTCCALLATISVILARLVIPMPNEFTRFSIEAVPVFLSGMLFGPLAGGLVGFTADFVGCLLSPYGFNPIFTLPPILYGVCAGLFRPLLRKRCNVATIALGFLPAIVFGSVLWQSFALAFTYSKDTLQESFYAFLLTRGIQFAVTFVLDVFLVYLLYKSNVFTALGLWQSTGKKEKHHDYQ